MPTVSDADGNKPEARDLEACNLQLFSLECPNMDKNKIEAGRAGKCASYVTSSLLRSHF